MDTNNEAVKHYIDDLRWYKTSPYSTKSAKEERRLKLNLSREIEIARLKRAYRLALIDWENFDKVAQANYKACYEDINKTRKKYTLIAQKWLERGLMRAAKEGYDEKHR